MTEEHNPLVVRVWHPSQLTRLARDLEPLFTDFLKRARDPFSVEDQWEALLHALDQGEDILFLLALNARGRPIGYLLAQAGYAYWRVLQVAVQQLYVRPGSPQGTISVLEDALLAWAKTKGCKVLSAVSLRDVGAAAKRFGMKPYGVTFIRVLEDSNGQGTSH